MGSIRKQSRYHSDSSVCQKWVWKRARVACCSCSKCALATNKCKILRPQNIPPERKNLKEPDSKRLLKRVHIVLFKWQLAFAQQGMVLLEPPS